MNDHARLTALVYPMGKPPVPTAADKAEAAAWIDAWPERDRTLCFKWLADNRADLIASHAVKVMGERIRREAKSSQGTPARTSRTGEAEADEPPQSSAPAAKGRSMISLTDQFKAFVASKPRNEAYDYGNADTCACGQFCDTIGLDWRVNDAACEARLTLERLNDRAVMQAPWTFGALADRLNATVKP